MSHDSIKGLITEEARRYTPYSIRFDKFKSDDRVVPFRLSPEPLRLRRTGFDAEGNFRKGDEKVQILGPILCEFFHLVVELYYKDERVRELLDRGKPEVYKKFVKPEYLFLRPDLILTPVEKNGKITSSFFVCEIETSPFGLGLAEMLNRAYCNAGFETIVAEDKLQEYLKSYTSTNGIIACSNKCIANFEQLRSLSNYAFGKQWSTVKIDENLPKANSIYRAFYLSEISSDENVKKLIEDDNNHFLPSLTPQFEEKAILTFIWDKRFEDYFRTQMGLANFEFLREILPPAWIVGEEQYFSPGLPGGINSTADLAGLGQGKRKWVLKQSGFGEHSSWGQGVTFLHIDTRTKIEEKLKEACTSKDVLYICQEFIDGVKRKVKFFPETPEEILQAGNDEYLTMNARVRLCLYYANMGKNVGDIIAGFVACRNDSIYIHGTSNAVQTAVVI